MAVADVERSGGATGAQVSEGVHMRGGQVFDVDVVAHASAIRGGVIGAKNRHLRSLAHRRLAGDLDQQCGVGCRLADAPAGVRPRDVEITQRRVGEGGGVCDPGEHPLGHELGSAVGIDRGRGGVLGRNATGWDAVHGGRGGEHEVPDPGREATLEERARRAGVVAVVLQRLAHRLGHDGVGREMHHRIDAVLLEQPQHRVAVADLADDERRIEHRLAKTPRQIVQDDDPFAAGSQLQDRVAADVACASGD